MRRMRGWARSLPAASLALVLALLPGCKTPGSFREPVAQFQMGTAQASTALGGYYAEMNRFERNLYLDERLYDTGLEVLATDASGQPTPLLGKVFTPESIQARMDAIALLGVYAERLVTLAGSEVPGKLPESAQPLGQQLGGLGQQLQTLAGAGGHLGQQVRGAGDGAGERGGLALPGEQAGRRRSRRASSRGSPR